MPLYVAPDNLNDRPECGTYGCRGVGHIKGPKFATHNSASGCPYSPQNLHKLRQMSDRLNFTKHEACDFEDEVLDRSRLEKTEKIKMEKPDKLLFSDERMLIIEKEIKQEDGDSSDKNDKSENRSENSEKYVAMYYIVLYSYSTYLHNLSISFFIGRVSLTGKPMTMRFQGSERKGLCVS